MTDEDRPGAFRIAYSAAHLAKQLSQRLLFRYRRAQRVMRVDSSDRQRRRVEPRAMKRLHVIAQRRARSQRAERRHLDHHCRELEQCVRCRVETTGLDIDHDGQETAEAMCDPDLRHQVQGATQRQPSDWPARNGTTSFPPNA